MNPLDKENEKQKFIFGCILLFANRIQTIGDRFDKDITMKQWFLIVCIIENKNNSPTLSNVADFMGCSRQNIKKMALILAEKGLVKFENAPNDSRSIILTITRKCEEFFSKRNNGEEKFLNDFFKGLTKQDINNVYKSFLKLYDNINQLDKISKIGFPYGNLDYLNECDNN